MLQLLPQGSLLPPHVLPLCGCCGSSCVGVFAASPLNFSVFPSTWCRGCGVLSSYSCCCYHFNSCSCCFPFINSGSWRFAFACACCCVWFACSGFRRLSGFCSLRFF